MSSLRQLLVLVLISIRFRFLTGATLSLLTASNCRCLPSQSCWPNPETWKSFNASIAGSLQSVTPLASPCHDPGYNSDACKALKQAWNDPFWRAEQPSALQAPNYELLGTQGCSINSPRSSPCVQGALPVYIVKASTASEVQKAVQFAAEHNLRLVVKNTGHDMTGRNTAPGSLSIWMHRLKDISFVDKFEFHPRAELTTEPDLDLGLDTESDVMEAGVSAVKVGAGVQWEELYEAAYKRGKTVVGAQCTSVGAAGGYPLGGGHSQISPSFGLAADNVLEFEVVTADGKLVVANACQNKLLFWALRGGGGGTFGVVTSVTYATHPALDGLVYASYSVSATTDSGFLKFLTGFLALSPYLADFGWGGSFLVNNRSLVIQYLLPNKDMAFANKTLLSPLFNDSARQGEQLTVTGEMKLYPSYYEWHRAVQCSNGKCGYPSGFTTIEGSRLVPRSTIRRSSRQLAEALVAFHQQGYQRVSGYLVGGGKVSKPRVNAVNPAWRRAILHVLVAGFYPDFTTTKTREAMETKMTSTMKLVRDMTPGSGSYMNEGDPNEPDWQQSFFGCHYKVLKYIKSVVDPKGLFVCKHCVGSEDWTSDLNCPVSEESAFY